MACEKRNLILRLLEGSIPPSDQEEVHGHIDRCPACKTFYDEVRTTWDVLDTWKIQTPESDLKARIMAGTGRRVVRFPVSLRFAASMVMALGLGIAAGSLVPDTIVRTSNRVGKPVAATEVLHALGMIDVGVVSATGLPEGLGMVPEMNRGEESNR